MFEIKTRVLFLLTGPKIHLILYMIIFEIKIHLILYMIYLRIKQESFIPPYRSQDYITPYIILHLILYIILFEIKLTPYIIYSYV